MIYLRHFDSLLELVADYSKVARRCYISMYTAEAPPIGGMEAIVSVIVCQGPQNKSTEQNVCLPTFGYH
jgi:hypothetical protein